MAVNCSCHAVNMISTAAIMWLCQTVKELKDRRNNEKRKYMRSGKQNQPQISQKPEVDLGWLLNTARLSEPIRWLTRKDTEWGLENEQQTTFIKLKELLPEDATTGSSRPANLKSVPELHLPTEASQCCTQPQWTVWCICLGNCVNNVI